MNIVSVESVRKTYQQNKITVEALKGVSLEIAPGEFLTLAGPSGSGKTTLLNLIGGLDNPDSGSISISGQEITAMSRNALAALRLRNIGFVFQSYNLIPVLSARENVEFILLLQGVGAKERRLRASAVLDELGLSDLKEIRPLEMSGGQQQRVAVARAIVSEPSLVLADEPTANLDSRTGAALIDLMKQMNEKKKITFIFSTHDKMVMERASRIITIRDGQIDGSGN